MVSEAISGSVELALGMVLDAQFGPVMLLSTGGTLIEVIGDRIALRPPVDTPRARLAIDRMRARPLLDGVRGRAAVNIDALVDTVMRFSELAVDASATVSAIDVNPLIVGPDRAVAVDALFKEAP
jgi:acetate---CoA ligase (ADP-forming)